MEVIIMPLIDNTFENQSAIHDENPSGGALIDATGGASGGTGGGIGLSSESLSSLTSAKSELLNRLNKLPAGALFKNGKFQFPVDLKNKLNLDILLSAMMSAINKNLPFSSLFKDGIQGIFSNFLTQLKSDANETWGFLKSTSGTFLQTLADKFKGILLSRIYVPDAVFLAGLYPLAGIGSNVAYKNHYIRNLCFKHDMPLSLAYIDSIEGIRYSVENNKGVSEAMKAARYGSFNVAFYIMRELQKEIKELEKEIKKSNAIQDKNKKQNNTTQLKKEIIQQRVEIFNSYTSIVKTVFKSVFDNYYGVLYDEKSLFSSLKFSQLNNGVPYITYDISKFRFTQYKNIKEKEVFNFNSVSQNTAKRFSDEDWYDTGLMESFFQDSEESEYVTNNMVDEDEQEQTMANLSIDFSNFSKANQNISPNIFPIVEDVYKVAKERANQEFNKQYISLSIPMQRLKKPAAPV